MDKPTEPPRVHCPLCKAAMKLRNRTIHGQKKQFLQCPECKTKQDVPESYLMQIYQQPRLF